MFSEEHGKVMGTHLWRDNVELMELTEVVRQKGDKRFCECLLRIREGRHTQEDIDLIETRLLSNLKLDKYSEEVLKVLHVFSTNAQVNEHNELMTKKLLEKKKAELREKARLAGAKDPEEWEKSVFISFKAVTTAEDRQKGELLKGEPEDYAPKQSSKCGGLEKELFLVKDMRVQLRCNVNVRDRS